MKKWFKRIMLVSLLAIGFLFFSNIYIINKSKDKLYTNVDAIKHNKVGLLLGTSKFTSNGNINYYYKYRIEAAVALYKAGKIEVLIVSGDNGTKEYDEPTQFKEDLVANGIPEEKIYLDYAGFRTLDSVIRAKEIFGQTSITIISQKFHNERAVFLANSNAIEAIGFNAKDVSQHYGFKTNLREYFAKSKAVIDILFNKQPKFLGEPIQIS
ncbi:MAG TPA: ElyC/SanA/YdcF family protein [Flavobacteriaceae bacterium]|nr:ElyC/SanA/YdcF family protein [Flavobacteriaceae bacterium]